MKKIFILTLIFCKLFSNSLHAQKTSDFTNQFKWLVGTWQIKTDGGNMVEQWTKVDDQTYKAVVNFLQNPTDSINKDPLEIITLKLENDTIYIFVNPKHDYPQIISYKPVNKKTLHAKIEGMVEGENKVIEFNYTKSK